MQLVAKNYQDGRNILIRFDGGLIEEICPYDANAQGLPFVAPGLVDLQVNGYKGIDFNSAELSAIDIRRIALLLLEQGVTAFFPTVITNASDLITRSLKEIVTACNLFPEVADSVMGIHLEGPFISLVDGPRGAHKEVFVRPPDWDLFCHWQEAAAGKIKLITLSPEWPDSHVFIEKCIESGVKVAIGHTAADEQQIARAVHAGATLSTHLGNACHQVLPRFPNYIWSQLAADQLWTSMIADGFHLPLAVLKVFLKVKPDHSFLVSDTTHLAGLPAGGYDTHIGSKVVLDTDGRLFMEEFPSALAGSAQSLLWCVNHLLKNDIVPLRRGWDLAAVKPLEFLQNKTVNRLAIGQKADLVLFDLTENGIQVQQTFKSGKSSFLRS